MDDLNQIFGFSKVEYLITFQSIIFGFVASLFLDGWGQVTRFRQHIKQDSIYALFSLVIFLFMLIHWWNLFGRAPKMSESIIEYLSVIPYTAMFYFIATLLFSPLKKEIHAGEKVDLRTIYFQQKNKNYIIILLFFFYDMLFTIHNETLIFRIGGIAICIVALMTTRDIVHLHLQFGSLSLIGLYIWSEFMGFFPESAADGDYSKTEHLIIFISVIYGFIITIFLEGWAGMFRMKEHAFSWTQFLWSLFSFIFLIDIWWGSWSRNELITNSLLHFLVFLIVPFLIYLICVLLFPKPGVVSYSNHFFSNKTLIFSLFASLLIVQIGLSYFFEEHDKGENLFRIAGIPLAVASAKIKDTAFHKVLISVAFSLLIFHMIYDK
ncbi:hypothetical protein [Marinoscillum sp. MHG1-6]|uniref:hypothetical protein n=1 Tax=Marinoscillum sp. MHG1-6 TaxID=2959627 RepID=UPI00215881BB|nr:hypothetical protein [Marinoscillum sp. MHG1-6]